MLRPPKVIVGWLIWILTTLRSGRRCFAIHDCPMMTASRAQAVITWTPRGQRKPRAVLLVVDDLRRIQPVFGDTQLPVDDGHGQLESLAQHT
jgi:hypothetical protein